MGIGTAIVALPREDELVNQISSEKKAHMTLLFLGETSDHDNPLIATFVQHVVDTMMNRFYMTVDRRGPLGPDEADVLFFEKNKHNKMITLARNAMLHSDVIKKAYDSVEQFPEWTPHLTLGYPEAPAKPLKEYQSFYGVEFDRIAVWFGDFDGPEFTIPRKEYGEDVAMSDISTTLEALRGKDFIQHALEEYGKNFMWLDDGPAFEHSEETELYHYGVKGMRWGVRKDRNTGAHEIVSARGNTATIKFNPDQHSITDHGDGRLTLSAKSPKELKKLQSNVEAAKKELEKKDFVSNEHKALVVAKSKPVSSLSNQELQEAANRMELERRYKEALAKANPTPAPKPTVGGAARKFVTDLLVDIGRNEVSRLAKGAVAIGVENQTVKDPALKKTGDAFRNELGTRIKPKKK